MSRGELGMDPERSMKPLLADAVAESVKLALIDSACIPLEPEDERPDNYVSIGDAERCPTPAEREAWDADPSTIPPIVLAGISPRVLARNVAVRLLGTGGWQIGEMYTGNASAREVFDASIARPDRAVVDEIAFDLGLTLQDEPE